MNIDKMVAGRELDELVLERVFGADVTWRDYEDKDSTYSPTGFYGTFPDHPTWCYHPGGLGSGAEEFRSVLDRMADLGFYIDMRFDLMTWTVVFTNRDTREKYVGNDVELEVAGCRAALKAVRE